MRDTRLCSKVWE